MFESVLGSKTFLLQCKSGVSGGQMGKSRKSYRSYFSSTFLIAIVSVLMIACSKDDQGLNFYSPQDGNKINGDPSNQDTPGQSDTADVNIKKLVTCDYGDERFGSSQPKPYSSEIESKLQELANKYFKSGSLNYGALGSSTEDLRAMCKAIQSMANTDHSLLDESFKKSFGVNLINLFSIQLATFNFVKTFGGQKANLPFKRSLLNIDPNANPYSNYFWSINGKELNINNLIEEFVTPLADPRLHLVLNLARKGDYSETLFLMSENIEKQLETAVSMIMDDFNMVDFDNSIEDLETIYLSDTFQRAFPSTDQNDLRNFLVKNIIAENYDFDPQQILEKKADGSYRWIIEWTPADKELNNGVF